MYATSCQLGWNALVLCMPLTCKRKKAVAEGDGTEQEEEFIFAHFLLRPLWFTLAQTGGSGKGADLRKSSLADCLAAPGRLKKQCGLALL
jgi:hypothetical protein